MANENTSLATNAHASHSPTLPTLPTWLGILLTLALIIIMREGVMLICTRLGIASAANVIGMVALLIILIAWRTIWGLPQWLVNAGNLLLAESAFAFLPISAGAGLLLFQLGEQMWGVILTILVSTLLPLWGLAVMSKRALALTDDGDTLNMMSPTGSHSSKEAQDER